MSLNTSLVHNKDFPDEILLHTFSYLDLENINTLRLVCNKWRSILEDETIWYPFTLQEFPLCDSIPLEDSWWKHYKLSYPYRNHKPMHLVNGIIYFSLRKTLFVLEKNPMGTSYNVYKTWTDHLGVISCLAYRTVGLVTYLFTGSTDKTIKIWEKITPGYKFNEVRSFAEHPSPISAIDAYKDGFISGDSNANLYLWKVNFFTYKWSVAKTSGAHEQKIDHLFIIKTGSQNTAISSCKKTIKIWKISEHRLHEFQSIPSINEDIKCLCLPKKSQNFHVGFANGIIQSWRPQRNGKYALSTILQAHQGPIHAIHLTNSIMFTSGIGSLKRWQDFKEIEFEKEVKITSLNSCSGKNVLTIYAFSQSKLFRLTFSNDTDKVTNHYIPITKEDQTKNIMSIQPILYTTKS